MANDKLYRTEAIVIRRRNMGEADKILTVYTPNKGKLNLVAKGVRRTTSRMGGHLELFMQCNLMVAKGRSLDLITQSETVSAFPNLRNNLGLIAYTWQGVELLDRLTEEDLENYPVFTLLSEFLGALEVGHDPIIISRAYELHLLGYLGYRPQLIRCVRCNEEIQPVINFFSPEMGGVLCPACGKIERRSIEVSIDAMKILRYLQKTTFATGPRLLLKPELRNELEHIMRSYTRYLLERDLKSAEFVHNVTS
ncbi:MAG: DNA repair protein RecO [Chloroflexota bacterium]|nr:DNA repair protein RecO [Chloroflexota bacterium]